MMTILVVELHSQARAIRDCQLVSLYLDATGCRLKCKIDASIKIDMRDDWRSQCYVCPCCNPDRSFCHAPDHTRDTCSSCDSQNVECAGNTPNLLQFDVQHGTCAVSYTHMKLPTNREE